MEVGLFDHLDFNTERNFFINNKQEVKEYNKCIFLGLIVLAFSMSALGTAVTFLPFFEKLAGSNLMMARYTCIITTAIFATGFLFSIFGRRNLNIHPLPFLYLVFLVLYIYSIVINMHIFESVPFVLLGVIRMMMPVLILDYRWRVNFAGNFIVTIGVFFCSYKFKPTNIFYLDLVLSIVYVVFGMIICSYFLTNQIVSSGTQREQLDRIREVEKAKGEAKTMFVAHMSHEIRTPVNSILGLNEIILRESNEPKIKEYANNIRVSGDTLLKIINDILDFSKIEAGKMDIIPSEYELSSTIMDLVNMASQKARSKNIELIINVDEELPYKLFGDELRLKQCILNILNNAVKFTEQGSVTLDFGYEKIDNGQIMLKVKVSDTGIGIREEDLSKLCDEFERVDENRNRTIEGSGLGLNIVSMLLQMMNSKLEIKSVYGEGSEFSFNIPQQVVWWEKIGNFNERYSELLSSVNEYHEAFHAPDARILVVDDTKMNIIVFEGLLKQTEIKIDSAMSGQEMLDMVKKNRYDAIFIDHRMPGMSGVEAFHAMQNMPDNLNRGVPCVALTANVVSGARDYYLREGFNDYLSKPVDSKLLEKLLFNIIPKEKQSDGKSKKSSGEKSLEDEFRNLDGISVPTAIQNCGSAEVLMVALKEYYASIKKRADDIEMYARQKDYRNYTVQVHALKSSSRLIGAIELSEKAAYLEKCGDEENSVAIAAKTGELLELYRSYIIKLDSLAERKEKKESMDINRFNEAMAAVKEFAGVFDFNAIDNIIEEVDKYELPGEVAEKFEEVKRLSRGADFNGLKEILS